MSSLRLGSARLGPDKNAIAEWDKHEGYQGRLLSRLSNGDWRTTQTVLFNCEEAMRHSSLRTIKKAISWIAAQATAYQLADNPPTESTTEEIAEFSANHTKAGDLPYDRIVSIWWDRDVVKGMVQHIDGPAWVEGNQWVIDEKKEFSDSRKAIRWMAKVAREAVGLADADHVKWIEELERKS